ncbi:uncharacterized protein LOC121727413 [Aricia agestis]|uniref:uncharacterized protein LOC121727413 n=1 Tax=Aricia agestis TaxID=91739 RepID=UPI001C20BCFF|nr:uncharacterized protein LOC121727413 [Aricia agestis]
MLRWGSDVIFFRVICVCLITVAFIFALILTNEFVDIDSFLMFKTLNKQEGVGRVDNEAKYNLCHKNSRDRSIIYRSKRSSIDPSEGSFKLIYKNKNIRNNEKSNSENAVDLLQLNLKTNEQLGENTTTWKALVKLRSKRQVNYGEGTTTKTINNNANATVEGNRHIDIEIKTHFDSKTTDAGRKQFISHLIDKIRQALRSDTEVISNQIENEPHFKIREQDPIVVTKNIIFDSKNFRQADNADLGKIDIRYKKPKFKHVKTAERNNKYIKDFQNSLGRRFQKPIADNAEIDHINSELYFSNSLSLLSNNIVGAGDGYYDQHLHSSSVQKSRYNELDDVIKVYHDTII